MSEQSVKSDEEYTCSANVCLYDSNGCKLSTSNNDVYINSYSMLVTPPVIVNPGKYEVVCSLYKAITHAAHKLIAYSNSDKVQFI